MIYFIKCIQDYGKVIQYDIAYSKAVYKYFFKAFYGQINKKKYKSEILKHNICHTKVIAIKDTILIVKVLNKIVKKNKLLLIYLI